MSEQTTSKDMKARLLKRLRREARKYVFAILYSPSDAYFIVQKCQNKDAAHRYIPVFSYFCMVTYYCESLWVRHYGNKNQTDDLKEQLKRCRDNYVRQALERLQGKGPKVTIIR